MLAAGKGAAGAVEILRNLTDFAQNDVAEAFSAVGRGIGAIMLLLVTLYYIISILDGGKFQLKMLLPLLIFMFVCNFSWIATPVVSFTNTIASSLVRVCDDVKAETKASLGVESSATIADMVNNEIAEGKTESDAELEQDILARKVGKEGAADEGGEEDDKVSAAGLTADAATIREGIDQELNQMNLDAQKELSGQTHASVGETDGKKGLMWWLRNLTLLSLLQGIVSWVCMIMSYVLRAFGGVMSGIIVAFGPITFAFAIFPGQGGTIKSWFIRLCQFSLWAPLCSLIDCFSVKIFALLAAAGTGASFAMGIGVAVCNLVALTSVPSISSMIIEGAQGAVSLSQGLHAMGSALTISGSVLAGKKRMEALGNKTLGEGVYGMGKNAVGGAAGSLGDLFGGNSGGGAQGRASK